MKKQMKKKPTMQIPRKLKMMEIVKKKKVKFR